MMNREKELIKMSRKTRMMKEQILPTVIEHIAVLGKRGSWFIEVNKVQYEGRPIQYDIRRWNPDHTHMGKGITLFEHEYEELEKVILNRHPMICPRCGREFAKLEGVEAVAKRIHEENQNVIVIPCETEVVSTNTSIEPTNTSIEPTITVDLESGVVPRSAIETRLHETLPSIDK